MKLKQITRLAMLLALSVVLSILESFLPFFNGMIPGLKLGLANTIVLAVLYSYSWKEATLLSLLRVFLVGILRTGLFNIPFLFSLSGALFSIIAMSLAKKYTKLSIVGTSVLGSLFHSLGQIGIAFIFLPMLSLVSYLPLILLFSLPAGIIVGYISKELCKCLKNS